MKNIKNFFSNKKNTVIVLSCVGVLVLIAGIIGITYSLSNNDEKKLTSELEMIGRHFYEDFYYTQIGSDESERTSFLSKYSAIGIKVDLENLARTLDNKDEELAKFVNSKTKEQCNTTNSKVTIYPKDPYGQKDYEIQVVIDCGFDKK